MFLSRWTSLLLLHITTHFLSFRRGLTSEPKVACVNFAVGSIFFFHAYWLYVEIVEYIERCRNQILAYYLLNTMGDILYTAYF